MAETLPRQKVADIVSVKKTKHKIAWQTDSNLPEHLGYPLSLDEKENLSLRYFQGIVYLYKGSFRDSILGIVNPRTMEFLLSPNCTADPVVQDKARTKLHYLLMGAVGSVRRQSLVYDCPLTEVEIQVGAKLREYISLSCLCPVAQGILQNNHFVAWIENIYPNTAKAFITQLKRVKCPVVISAKSLLDGSANRETVKSLWLRFNSSDKLENRTIDSYYLARQAWLEKK